jgi:quercetin dioxygenase-like cupin family protein
MWEMHPNGDEIVCLLSGVVTFILDQDNEHHEMTVNKPGDYVVVPKGTWHTAKTTVESTMLFITAGEGTEHRHV